MRLALSAAEAEVRASSRRRRRRSGSKNMMTYANNIKLILAHALLEEFGNLLSRPGASWLVFGV